MGAWRGSVFTSGHVLSLGLGNSSLYMGRENKLSRMQYYVPEFEEFNRLK